MSRIVAIGLIFGTSINCSAATVVKTFKGLVSAGATIEGARPIKQKNKRVLVNSWVKTGVDSLALLQLDDGLEIKLDANSAIQVSKEKSGLREIRLRHGSIFSRVDSKKFKKKFQVRTKTATMGVRGTVFFVGYGRNTSKGKDLWMCVQKGEVEMTNLADKKKVAVKEGQGVIFPAGESITPPKVYPWTKKLNWNFDETKGTLSSTVNVNQMYYDLLDFDYD